MIKCPKCNHEFKKSKFAYKFKQRCPECGSIVEIVLPSGMGFIPPVIALLPAIVFFSMGYSLWVALAIFIVFYWPIEIIMNTILIYNDKYEIQIDKSYKD